MDALGKRFLRLLVPTLSHSAYSSTSLEPGWLVLALRGAPDDVLFVQREPHHGRQLLGCTLAGSGLLGASMLS